jgi:[ribosomal protein S5]-alanine N-acetyltransferase
MRYFFVQKGASNYMYYQYPTLQTERLFLIILTLEHIKEVFRHFSDKDITEFMDIEPCKDLKEAEEIIQYHLDDIGCRWGLFIKEDDQFIGTCGFHYFRKNSDEMTAEVGFDLAKTHWGKGYMREVMETVIEFGFSEMGLAKIDATVEPGNERSLALMRRLGFTQAEELQDNLVYFYIQK